MSTTKELIGANIAYYREAAGLSKEELGEQVRRTRRQISRYEQADQEPTATVLDAIADALDVSVAQLLGRKGSGPDLSSLTWASWQTWQDGIERIDTHPMRVIHDGNHLALVGERAQGEMAIELGDYAWVGELIYRPTTSTLIGWYESNDEGTNYSGGLSFTLHPQGTHAIGHWSGPDYDGIHVFGWGVLARSRELAEQQLLAVKDLRENLRTWPKTTQ